MENNQLLETRTQKSEQYLLLSTLSLIQYSPSSYLYFYWLFYYSQSRTCAAARKSSPCLHPRLLQSGGSRNIRIISVIYAISMEQWLRPTASIIFIWIALRRGWERGSSRGSAWSARRYRRSIGFGVGIVMRSISRLAVGLWRKWCSWRRSCRRRRYYMTIVWRICSVLRRLTLDWRILPMTEHHWYVDIYTLILLILRREKRRISIDLLIKDINIAFILDMDNYEKYFSTNPPFLGKYQRIFAITIFILFQMTLYIIVYLALYAIFTLDIKLFSTLILISILQSFFGKSTAFINFVIDTLQLHRYTSSYNIIYESKID